MAVSLVARGLHQDLASVKKMPLPELFVWAKMAAVFEGVKFN
ncbi:MAG: hypothetical protein ACO1N8_06360 [Methylophilus sp.]